MDKELQKERAVKSGSMSQKAPGNLYLYENALDTFLAFDPRNGEWHWGEVPVA